MKITTQEIKTGKHFRDKEIIVRRMESVLHGLKLVSFQVRLKGSCCFTGNFSAADKAIKFYIKRGSK